MAQKKYNPPYKTVMLVDDNEIDNFINKELLMGFVLDLIFTKRTL